MVSFIIKNTESIHVCVHSALILKSNIYINTTKKVHNLLIANIVITGIVSKPCTGSFPK